jgi:hypothetical protein
MNENPSWKAPLNRLLDSLREVVEGAYWFGENLALVLVLSAITFPRGGWSEVPLRGMNLVEYTRLLERLWDKPTEEIESELDKLIPEYFRRDDHAPLSEMVGSWYLYVEDRRQVFEDALWAHKQKRYTLSIPALAAQVEGYYASSRRSTVVPPTSGRRASTVSSATIETNRRGRGHQKRCCQSFWTCHWQNVSREPMT